LEQFVERPNAQIESLKVPPPAFSFYEFDEYERLGDAERSGQEVLITVLLGGDAGLRMGEILRSSNPTWTCAAGF
jgi:hypothetical protein